MKVSLRSVSFFLAIGCAAAIFFLPSLVSSARAATIPEYELVDLGVVTLTGPGACDINQQGQVALNLSGTGYIWDDGVLSPPAGVPNNNNAFAINEAGHLAWISALQARFYDGNEIISIPALETGNWMFAESLNNHDQVVGYGRRSSAYRPFVWDGTTGVLQELPSLPGQQGGRAYDINDAATIVGQVNDLPVQWVGETCQALTLPSGEDRGSANVINASGQIAGYTFSTSISSNYHATLWTDGVPTTLGPFGSLSNTWAWGLNDLGDVVGYASTSASGTEQAFLYKDGTMYDLTALIDDPAWDFRIAYAINNTGQIVGKAYSGGQAHAILLTPVPEPSTLVLLSGLVCLGRLVLPGRRRRD